MAFLVVCNFGLRHNAFDFGHGNHWQESDKQQEEREEQPERPGKGHYIPYGRFIVRPARRQKIVGERGDHDDESFKPHADVYQNRRNKHHRHRSAQFLEPEKLRDKDVARNHNPVAPGVWPGGAVDGHELLI